MACAGRWAEAWAYAAFWCSDGNVITGLDDSGGAGNPGLQDLSAQLASSGVEANAGMVIYNTTAGTSGEVTAVTDTTLTATGVTWDDGDAYRIVPIGGQEIATIEHYLNVTAGNIHAALAAANACDCALAAWASSGTGDGADYLGKLNIIEAGAFHTCSCGMPGQRMDTEQRRLWLEWSNEQLARIREGTIELCDGATAAGYPSLGIAQQGHTRYGEAEIIVNRLRRTST